MGLLDRWRQARSRRGLATTPTIPTAALPPGGRSSRETHHSLTAGLATYLSFWDGVEPLLPPAYLEQIIRIAIVNPDMSQAVSNWVALGNPGHDLILAGDEDDPCVEPAVFMKRVIPNSGLVIFPQSGHTINLEEPELFNRVVFDFLRAVEGNLWREREEGTGVGFLASTR